MIALKPRKQIEIAIRVLLIAVILFNALALNSVPAHAEQDIAPTKVGQLESRSIPTYPTFERPEARIAGLDEQHTQEPALLSTMTQGEYIPMYSVSGEGLRLENTGFNFGDGAADWIVQKSAHSNNPTTHETLFTFSAAAVRRGDSILNNFVASLPYTVKADEAGPGYWMSFQLAGKQTSGSTLIAGTPSAKFYVDIVSPAGLPVTCDSNTGGDLTATCVQDSASHVHGMADSGPVPAQPLDFNGGGVFAKFAVHGLTAGQLLIVTFGSTSDVNGLNTLSNCPLACNTSSVSATQGSGGKPINTRTGNYEYFTEDISIPTSAGNLSFTRDYVSAATSFGTTLSPGWTHNHDTRLIFSTDPEGLPNQVLFKAHTTNKYAFYDDVHTNIYIPEPGLQATLVQNQGTPITYTLKDREQKTYTFDENGRLLTYVDAQGHTWTYTYYPDGKLDRISADGGVHYLDLDYNPQGRLSLVKDHTNRSVSYGYNANGDLNSFTDLLGQTWTYEYHTTLPHLLTRVAAPGNVTVERQEYYANGKAWKQYDGNDDLIVELIYNADGTTTIKDALNHTETHAYDARGTLVNDTNGAGGSLAKQYDFNFRPSVITDPLVNPPTNLTWSYNGANLTQIKDALQKTTNITYGSYNNPTNIVDPRSYETKYFYLDANFPTLPTRIEYPLVFPGDTTNIHTDYEYYPPSSGASTGKVKFATDALGNQTYYEYNTGGQTTKVVTGHGTANALTTLYSYDSLGRLTDVTDPQGIVTHNDYDNAGRLTKTTQNVHPTITTQNYQDKYNIITEYRYDLRGNQIALIDTYGTITRTYYDLSNRPVTVVQNLVGQTIETTTAPAAGTGISGENIRTDTQYDDAGNVIATIDPAGFTNRTYYDAANRPNLTIQHFVGTGVYDPANPDQNIRTEYFYDANSNVIATRGTLGVITRTYYDELNRPQSVIQNLYITGTTADINAALEDVPYYTATYPDRNLRTDT